MHRTTRIILTFTISLGSGAYAEPASQTRPQADVAAGKGTFREYCAVCHGADAKGNGPAVGSLRTPPSDLTTLSQRNGGKFPADLVRDSIYSISQEVHRVWRRAIPAHGSPDMPMWGDMFHDGKSNQKLVDERVRNIAAYLESLQE